METKASSQELKDRLAQNYDGEDDRSPHDVWMLSIKQKLGLLEKRRWHWSIDKVPNRLRKLKEDAFSPSIVSIGPFHHRMAELQAIEEHKWRYMLLLLHRTRDPVTTLDYCSEALLKLEGEAREYYAGDINFDKRKLVEILLVDGCFIVELFIRFSCIGESSTGDPIFNNPGTIPTLQRDLALLENQIPFVVLQTLFDIIHMFKPPQKPLPSFVLTEYALLFFQWTFDLSDKAIKEFKHVATSRDQAVEVVPLDMSKESIEEVALDFSQPRVEDESLNISTRYKHLLDILHNVLTKSCVEKIPEDPETWEFKNGATKLSKVGIRFECPIKQRQECQFLRFLKGSFNPFRCSENKQERLPHRKTEGFKHGATALLKAGVRFQQGTTEELLYIKFENGVLKMPRLFIHQHTQSIFRNLIAYEQCNAASSHHITSYALLMDSLIHSSEDAKLLQVKGIIKNELGDDGEDVSTFFKSLTKEVVIMVPDFYYESLRQQVNEYRSRLPYCLHRRSLEAIMKLQLVRWHGYMEILKHDYFSNPWSTISFIAAAVLLIFTGLQTFYSARSYYPH